MYSTKNAKKKDISFKDRILNQIYECNHPSKNTFLFDETVTKDNKPFNKDLVKNEIMSNVREPLHKDSSQNNFLEKSENFRDKYNNSYVNLTRKKYRIVSKVFYL